MINVLDATFNCAGMQVPMVFASIVHYAILLIKIVVPILLIVFGMLDMAKAVTGNDEKEMKEAQKKLIRRVIYAIVVFLVVSIAQLLISIVATTGADKDTDSISKCVNTFVSGKEVKATVQD